MSINGCGNWASKSHQLHLIRFRYITNIFVKNGLLHWGIFILNQFQSALSVVIISCQVIILIDSASERRQLKQDVMPTVFNFPNHLVPKVPKRKHPENGKLMLMKTNQIHQIPRKLKKNSSSPVSPKRRSCYAK